MSKDEIRTGLRAKLEQAIRDRRQLQGEKAEAVKGFNDAIGDVDKRLDGIIAELDECAVTLPFGKDEVEEEL